MVEERICNFIRHRRPAGICDDCIARQLGLRHRQHVQRATKRLADVAGFQRRLAPCSLCGQAKLAISAAPAAQPSPRDLAAE